MSDRKVLAYKIYQCAICKETRESKDSMCEHLREDHGVRYMISDGEKIYLSN